MAALLTSCANGDAEEREEGASSPQPQRGGGQHQTATAVNCRGVQNCLCYAIHACVCVCDCVVTACVQDRLLLLLCQ